MRAFGGTVAKFATPVEADGTFQRVMRLALVEPDLNAALQIGIQIPIDHEQGPLDAADFPQGCCHTCIAVFQPITRDELSSFFGKEIRRDLIGNLRGSGMIASGPRSPTPSAPCVNTQTFLLEFRLATLRDVPDFEALKDLPAVEGEAAGRRYHARAFRGRPWRRG